MQSKPVAEQEIGKQLLLETAAYAESSVCRRKVLLHYFGEDYEKDNCGNCDNCLNPKKKVEAQELLCTLLETVVAVKENFKSEHLINIILGKETSEVIAHQHDELETFGTGTADEEKTWNAVLQQALLSGYLLKEVENYGIIKITAAGKKFIKSPKSFKIVEDRDFEEEENEDMPMRAGGTVVVDPALFSMLKDLRKKVAKKHDLPPYVIFQDPSLEDMSIQYPITIEELQTISGVGAGKAQKFGAEFVKLIKAYVDEKEILRPQDMVVKGVANKASNKIFIIQSIDRKMDFEDIARAKNLDMDELLTEIEAIVNSGTRLDIQYYLNTVMDEDKVEDIYLYFKEDAETDSLDAAIDELGSEYSEEEIRLVRIKFISEVAN